MELANSCIFVLLLLLKLQIVHNVTAQGVYLSLRGRVYANNSVILVTEIGQSNNGLKCVTDSIQCCTYPNRAGEWFYPNGTRVLTSYYAYYYGRAFYRTRGYNGTVTLNRLDSTIMSPTGEFCCMLPDSERIEQSLCANIISAKVIDGGDSITVGQNYFLNCSVSGDESITSTINYNYHWIKNNVSHSQIVANSSILDFSPFRLPDIGYYSCNITVSFNQGTYAFIVATREVLYNITTPLSVSMKADKTNPIRPVGSAVILTCTVDLDPAVDVSVTVNTVWTGPGGVSLWPTAPVMVNLTRYTSTVNISSFGRDQSGNYVCAADIDISLSFSFLNYSSVSKLANETIEVTVGVYLSLGGKVYANNSVIFITEIGSSGNGLQCVTDQMLCCRYYYYGTRDWFYPNGTTVSRYYYYRSGFYRTRYDNGTIILNRLSSTVMSPTGLFCCRLPDARMIEQTLCANIVPVLSSVFVTSNKPNPIRPVGSAVTLTCSVNLDQAVDVPVTVNTEWTGPAAVTLYPSAPVVVNLTRYTSTVSIATFGRSQSGNYTCTANITSSFSFLNSGSQSDTIEVIVGVYLSLRGRVYANNSVIIVSEIGQSDNGLQCVTDFMLCCRYYYYYYYYGTKDWFYPNGTTVLNYYNAYYYGAGFYRTRGYNGTVTLNRLDSSIMSPTGQLCCVLPDSERIEQTLCANIISAEVIDGGDSITVGEIYFLNCSVSGDESVIRSSTINYHWIKNNTTHSQIMANSSVLNFSPFRLSDVGYYSCKVTVSFNQDTYDFIVATREVLYNITTPLSVSMKADKSNPIRPVGSAVILTCSVDLDPAVDVPVTVNTVWTGPAAVTLCPTAPVMVNLTRYTSTVNISSFGRDQSGNYDCAADIDISLSFSFLNYSNVSELVNETIGVTVGVYLSLRGRVYANNSVIFITEIGSSDNGLQCVTDQMPCCRYYYYGTRDWFYPDGGTVLPYYYYRSGFYRTRYDNGTIILNRLSSTVMSPTGLFCCRLPDARMIEQTLCANIVPVLSSVFVTSNKLNPIRPVGSAVILTCTVDLDPAVDVPVTVNTEWTGPAGVTVYPTAPVMVNLTRYISTVSVSSFGRNQSGNYTCTAKSTLSSSFVNSRSLSDTIEVIVGVYLSLRGRVYANNSVIVVSEIGQSNNGLQCVSDFIFCCRYYYYGTRDWSYPNGATVLSYYGTYYGAGFYRTRGDDGTVVLNRLDSSIMSPNGKFCCVLPDSERIEQTLCANIISAKVIDGGDSITVGENYFLNCSVSGDESITSTINYNYHWIKNNTSLLQIVTNSSVLNFSPFQLSDIGYYSCNVTFSFNQDTYFIMATREVLYNITTPLSVSMKADKPNPIRPVGSAVTLTCTVDLDPAVDVPVTVNTEWTGPAAVTLYPSAPVMVNLTRYTSTVNISSFGRDQSGNYDCAADIDISLSFPFLNSSVSELANETIKLTVGVYLSLRGRVYANNSVIFITEIGKSNNGLQCVSDLIPCCRYYYYGSSYGDWFYPNGATVLQYYGTYYYGAVFYRTRGYDGTVILNRLDSTIMSPTGEFCCMLPDSERIEQSLCANIISAKVIDGGDSITVGQNYFLNCSVSGDESITSTINYNYHWIKNNTSYSQIVANSSVLNFSPFQLSDVGFYSCNVTISFNQDTYDFNVATREVLYNITTPFSVSMKADKSNPIRPVGSAVTLTCIVDLDPAVDVPVIVNTEWTGPAEVTLYPTAPVMVNLTRYTSTFNIASFGRNISGNYDCAADIDISLSFSFLNSSVSELVNETVEVTVGVYLSLGGRVYANNSVIFITEIGSSDNGLQCVTDFIHCCQYYYYGTRDWFYPDGRTVSRYYYYRSGFYRTRYDNGTIILNHLSSIDMSPTGQFCCRLPDARMIEQTLCANIVPVLSSVSVTSNKPIPIRPIASAVSLTCTVDLDPAVDVPVTVNTKWTGPVAVTLYPTVPVMVNLTRYTSTINISSFGRDQSGNYTCTAQSTSSFSFLNSGSQSDTIEVTVGVYLSLGERVYANNSVILVTEIGQSNNGLQCVTDLVQCCGYYYSDGDWLFPNGATVPNYYNTYYYGAGFYRTRGNNGTVNLYRQNNTIMSPTGLFCCMLPDGGLTEQTLCANIFSAKVIDGGDSITVGENYFLNCSVSGDESITSTINYNYHWIKNNTSYSQIVANSSVLKFSPFRLSDIGYYSCNVTVSFNQDTYDFIVATREVLYNITAPFSVSMKTDKPNPIRPVGSAVTLTCTVDLDPAVDVPVTVNTVWTGPAAVTLYPSAPVMVNLTRHTSNVTIRSFGRVQSGNYTCTANITSSFSSLNNSGSQAATAEVTVGVYLSLRGRVYANNSVILVTEIGQSNNGLLCVTDWTQCCQYYPYRAGEWFYPNGTRVEPSSGVYYFGAQFYRTREDNGTVTLNRLDSTIMSPTGEFCCMLPDSERIEQTLCANIISAQITDGGVSQTVGTKYTLTCKLSGTENVKLVIYYKWMKSSASAQLQIKNNSNTLIFPSFRLSDAGEYVCQVTIISDMFDTVINASNTHILIAQIPSASEIAVTSNKANPIRPVGSAVTLTCTVELSPLAMDVLVTVNTVWTGPARFITTNTAQPVMGSTTTYTSTAVVSSFGRDQSGVYNCAVTITSLSAFIAASNTQTVSASLNVVTSPSTRPERFSAEPDSRTVHFTWSPPSYLKPTTIIASYTLTCTATVEGVDPVTVTYAKAGSYTLGGFRPATVYNCSVSASNSAGVGPPSAVTLKTQDERSWFQLRIKEVDNCPQWVAQGTVLKLDTITVAVINKIQESCKCGLVRDRIDSEVFRCFPESPHIVIYRASLYGTASTNSSDLISLLEQWIAEGAAIVIQRILLSVDDSCAVVIPSIFTEVQCLQTNTMFSSEPLQTDSEPMSSNPVEFVKDSNSEAIIGGSTVAVVVVIAIVVTILIIATLVLKTSRKNQKNQQLEINEYQMPNAATVEVPSQKGYSAYDDSTDEHQYEGLDKYNAAYDEVDFPSKAIPTFTSQQKQSDASEGHELTQYSASMPIGSDEITVL